MQQLSVSSLLRYLKNRLEADQNIQKIYVTGEISDFNHHFSGHLYFTLKDEYAAIPCVMFRQAASSLNFDPKTGDKVVVYANTSIYEAMGKLQLYVLKMNLDGLGELYRQYEELKRKLEKEGLFDQDHKIVLENSYPEKIAVLVGDKSAAMSDIKTAFSRRWPLCDVDYYPVLVQGTSAPQDIVSNLLKVDDLGYDAIILARGGGSFEDLFCFNDEDLIRCIYGLNTFIVSGIGHEQDFTLTDFVCDLRAATPTAAVELITPNISDVKMEIDSIREWLDSTINDRLDRQFMRYDYIVEKLINYCNHFSSLNMQVDNDIRSIRQHILHSIDRYDQDIANMLNTIGFKVDFRLNNERLHYKRLNTLLEAYSSQNVLKRGYTLVLQDDRLVKNRKDLKNKDFTVRFNDGDILARKEEDL